MPRFLVIGNYAPTGAKAILAAGGTARRSAIEKMLSDVGGRLETFDFAFGTDDVYAIVELPDHKTAAAVSLTINASGVAATRTIVLMTPEEVDAVGQVHADYQPPTA
ncbi:GYD domain-containing protein [Geodermatophilus sp. SYSU D01186]